MKFNGVQNIDYFQGKKDKLGLLAQPRGGRGRKGLGVPNPLNRFLKICLK